jgi:hypothetical protein
MDINSIEIECPMFWLWQWRRRYVWPWADGASMCHGHGRHGGGGEHQWRAISLIFEEMRAGVTSAAGGQKARIFPL